MTAQPGEVLEPEQIGFLVTGDWCDRCGDTNYREEDRVCITCTFPDDPDSRAFLEARVVDAITRAKEAA